MRNATLVFKDINKQRNFETQCNQVKDQANILIQFFNDLQPFTKIHSRDEAENLILRPLEYYDSIILKNIQLPKNNLQVNVSALCDLYSIPRNEFIKRIGLIRDQVPGGCESCNKPAPSKGNKEVLTFTQYEPFSKYLICQNGFFDLDLIEIEKQKDSFNTYLENEKQIETFNFWVNLCATLNSLTEKGYLGPSKLHDFQTMLQNRVTFSYADSKLYLNSELVLQEIFKNK